MDNTCRNCKHSYEKYLDEDNKTEFVDICKIHNSYLGYPDETSKMHCQYTPSKFEFK